ncbi:MAG: hypothetical protein ACREOZ_04340, partial [Gloeomargaritales cyanobacterium]
MVTRRHPVNFSFFFMGSSNPLSAAESSMALELKASEGKGLDHADIIKATKQVIEIPTTFYEMLHQIQNLCATLDFIFGNKSIIAVQVRTWMDHMYDNMLIYESIHESNENLYAMIGFYIDSSIQEHLNSCVQSTNRMEVKDQCLEFSDTQTAITRRTFRVDLPKYIAIRKRKAVDNRKESINEGEGKRPNTNERQEGRRIVNRNAVKKWQPRANESYNT